MKIVRMVIVLFFILSLISGCTKENNKPVVLEDESAVSSETETGTKEIESMKMALPLSSSEDHVTLDSPADFDTVLNAIETGTEINGPITAEGESAQLWIYYEDGSFSFYYLWLADEYGRYSFGDGTDRTFSLTLEATKALQSFIPND